jgi:putative tricarboxylic transport membrane protein
MNTERVVFLVLLSASLYGLISSVRMPLGELSEPGPGFFPLALSIILFSLSGFGFLFSTRSNPRPSGGRSFGGNLGRPVKIVLSTGAAILFFESAGFLAVGAFLLSLLFFWVSGYRFWKALLFGVAGGAVGWLLFVKGLGVSLPGGILGL